jgi:hypothetical protein
MEAKEIKAKALDLTAPVLEPIGPTNWSPRFVISIVSKRCPESGVGRGRHD